MPAQSRAEQSDAEGSYTACAKVRDEEQGTKGAKLRSKAKAQARRRLAMGDGQFRLAVVCM